MKVCTMCGEEKELEFFEPKTPGGKKVFGKCRKCRNLLREGRRKAKRKDGNQVEIDRARDKWYKRKYGITLEEYDTMLLQQDSKCAICGKSASTVARRLNVDHDHVTTKVRGLLCHSCNVGLGSFRDDLGILLSAAGYISMNSEQLSL